MDKEFVPPQESLELKEIEFDEPCFVVWPGIEGQKLGYDGRYFSLTKGYKNSKLSKEVKKYAPGIIDIAAPTFSQAFRWFREKGYENWISYNEEGYNFIIKWQFEHFGGIETLRKISSYPEAELACLRKLIEIVKNEN